MRVDDVPVPAILPSPFASVPHPLADAAARALERDLTAATWPELARPGGGKMFGVLVVRTSDGQLDVLRAFSGMLGGAWHQPGFVGPAFDVAARDAFWPAGEAALGVLAAAIEAQVADPALAASLAALDEARAALVAVHAQRRDERKAGRAALAPGDAAAAHAFDQASRADGAELRQLKAAQAAPRATIAAAMADVAARRAALTAERAALSRQLSRQLADTMQLRSFAGDVAPIDALFAPAAVPGGAGECAAPKLLAAAQRLGVTPLALAEFWWGAPPLTGGRLHGHRYPACRGKCGVVLPFMLRGLTVEPAPEFGADAVDAAAPREVFADGAFVVVDKPAGLLSVPGRSGTLTDSVATRMRARHPHATGPLVVHRLDLDTSGLLLVALDAPTHKALAAQFARREVTKRYVAWLDGDVVGDVGVIELPLRVDLDDRPRQIVDPVHGLDARTRWQVRTRVDGRTLVDLWPETGRTHQLRVHCAVGLGAPVAGDRLYGRGIASAPRLLLHATELTFVHAGERRTVGSPPPFALD